MISIEDIIDSVSVPELIKDLVIQRGVFNILPSGTPEMYTGGFTVVFPVTVDDKKWAFRCWHAPLGDMADRLHILSTELKLVSLPYFCEFEYVEEGIVVNGEVFPTTRMKWIDGVDLASYICQNTSKDSLQKLAKDFKTMCIALHNAHIAHGDLQHGNILVDKNGNLFLVDYDSVYMPAMGIQKDIIAGKADYQHPKRTANKVASEKLDYFSELIIYLSILAISENPDLVNKYGLNVGQDCLLFKADDYKDLENSAIYEDLMGMGKDFPFLFNILRNYLSTADINELEPFEDILFRESVSFTCSTSKLVRGKEHHITLEWSVEDGANVQLVNGSSVSHCKCRDSLKVLVKNDAIFKLIVKSKEGITIEKQLAIKFFDECSIDFTADKQYSYPTIPVKLSWHVENANKVWLDSMPVEATGTKVVEPGKATTYVLSAEDEFGIKEKKMDIQMLPLPQVKSLFVPTPNITSNLSVHIKQPKYQVEVRFPTINVDWIKVETPKVPSLTDLGLKVELSLPKTTHTSIIKRVYKLIENKINKKLLEYEQE